MARLKDRQRQIPNGFRFALPEVGYQSSPFASFDTIVNSVQSIVNANPAMAKARKWPQKREDIALWVEDFQARICIDAGWNNYVIDPETSPPKHGPPPGRLGALVAGGRTIAEWLGDGFKCVDPPLASRRAKTCSNCPLNQPGDFSNFFERATSEMLRSRVSEMNNLRIETPYDASLGVCDACYCPMRLKVWTPFKHIWNHMTPQVERALHPDCWMHGERDEAALSSPGSPAAMSSSDGSAT